MATKNVKVAKVEIELPDGTKISARGPMAEQMAHRLMNSQPHYNWPYWFSGTTSLGATLKSNTSADSGLTISGSNGAVSHDPADLTAALGGNLGTQSL